ncbi:MAG: 50S ribosomal protein L23 [Chlamydiae bacterium]|nr:50S ribosomal protein L23 [Chlamydiota bacterium]
MFKKNPYEVVISRYITEKAQVLQQLQHNTSNPSVRKCEKPKYVFVVDKRANKKEIAEAIEEIYVDKNIKVAAVNVINVKPKKRTVRGQAGFKAGFKKAIVTLQKGDQLESNV